MYSKIALAGLIWVVPEFDLLTQTPNYSSDIGGISRRHRCLSSSVSTKVGSNSLRKIWDGILELMWAAPCDLRSYPDRELPFRHRSAGLQVSADESGSVNSLLFVRAFQRLEERCGVNTLDRFCDD